MTAGVVRPPRVAAHLCLLFSCSEIIREAERVVKHGRFCGLQIPEFELYLNGLSKEACTMNVAPYVPSQIEPKWQRLWDEQHAFRAENRSEINQIAYI